MTGADAPPPRAEIYRVAKAVGEWDVDKLEREMPQAAIAEWNLYLNWELTQWTEAIMGALPAAGAMAEGRNTIRLTDPKDIAGLFDGFAKGDS